MICPWALKLTLVSTQQGNHLSWTTGQALRLRGEFLCPLPFFEPHLPDGVSNLLLHPDKAETTLSMLSMVFLERLFLSPY